MRAVPFHLQGKGVLEAEEISGGLKTGKRKRETEPTSVLERRRSPSPPTSTSTLSASLGGGSSGSTDTAGVAAGSGNPLHKWPPTQEGCSSAAAADAGRKEEWVASDLRPFPMGSAGERCSAGGGGGVGMDDLESILSESAASPGNEQSFFRWFMGDMDDQSLKQLLQVGGGSSEFDGGLNGFGVVDSSFGFDGVSSAENVNVNVSAMNPLLASGSDFGFGGNSIGNRLLVSSTSPSPLPNFKGSCFGGNNNSNPSNPNFSPPANSHLSLPISLPQGAFYQHMEPIDEKPQLFNPQVILNQQQVQSVQNPAFLLPLSFSQQEHQQQQPQHLPPQSKPHHPTTIFDPGCQFPKTPFADFTQEMILHQQMPQSISNEHLFPHHLQQRPMSNWKLVVGAGDNANHQQQQQAVVDQLFKAAESVETGNSIIARGILARLNHQLSHVGKPFHRAAFYFKEALQLLLNANAAPNCNPPLANSVSPLDVVFKISAYKVFSEISPFLQFVNFTSNQAILEAIERFDRIHLIDFDIGFGGQWASFMQELASRRGGVKFLKITVFASLSSCHPLELKLTKENLTHFANDLNISLEFKVINLDSIDLSSTLSLPAIIGLSDSEAVAVNFPVGSSNPLAPLLIGLVKQVSPKIVVSIDHGCERSELPFSQHILHALQFYSELFDSLDAVNVNSDAVRKIEKFLLQPRIENAVLARHKAAEKMPPWRTLFASAGFSPLAFSNFTETQAEYMVNRLPVRGFHVEKCQASLYLCWQSGELVSVSAWRC